MPQRESIAFAGMLNSLKLREMVRSWLDEDIPAFDVGGGVVGVTPVRAQFFVKSPLVLSGLPFVTCIFTELGCAVDWAVREGTLVKGSSMNRVVVGTVSGPAYAVLQGERTSLEVLCRSSACATYARACVEAAKSANPTWAGRVACTRKTTPGTFREVEKYGAMVGGADPHRYSLSTMVMLKDNHIDIAGGVKGAVSRARELCGFSSKIEVECRSTSDALEAVEAGADVVMLDNFTADSARESLKSIRSMYPNVLVELSGGVHRETVGSFAIDGVDVVSIGKITHGPPSVDISLKIDRDSLRPA